MTVHGSSPPPVDGDTLFLDYLDAVDRGSSVDVEGLVACAPSEHAALLRQRIRICTELRAIGAEQDGGGPADEALRRYEIERVLGEGGSTSLAWDQLLLRPVVIKFLDTRKGVGDWDNRLREARALAQLQHSHVVRALDAGRRGGRPFLTMEYIDGPSLADVIAALRSPEDADARTRAVAEELRPMEARLACLHDLAGALAHCHGKEVTHRDIKPANVVFDRDDRAVLVDFGSAFVDGTEWYGNDPLASRFEGSAPYVAPEQVELGTTGASHSSDIFSLGTLAYELLTLESPFRREDVGATLDAVQTAEPRSARALVPALPRNTEHLLTKALAKAPDERYASAAELGVDVQNLLARRPLAHQSRSSGRWRARLRRHRKLLGGAALALLLAAMAAILGHAREANGIETALAALDGPGHPWPVRISELQLLHRRAQEADHSLVGALWPGEAGEGVRRAIRALDRELVAAFDAGRGAEEPDYWVPLFEQLASSFAGVIEPHESTMWGRVRLPEDSPNRRHTLLRQLPCGPTLGPTSADEASRRAATYWERVRTAAGVVDPRLTPGYYRMIVRDTNGEVTAEYEWLQTPWSPRREVAPVDRAAWVEALPEVPERRIAVRPFPVSSADSGEEWERATPSFRLGPLVTVKQFREYCRTAGIEVPRALEGEEDSSPAFVYYSEAQAFARASGARLPTALELRIAHELAEDRAVEGLSPLGDELDMSGEWVSDRDTTLGPTGVCYATKKQITEFAERTELMWLVSSPDVGHATRERCEEPASPENANVGVAFRIAATTDTPDRVEAALTPPSLE